jgi:hypothetical protein
MKWLRARCVSRDRYPRSYLHVVKEFECKRCKDDDDQHACWREEFKIEEAMKETYPDIFDGFGRLFGRDKEGRPVAYCLFWSCTLILGSDGS